MSVSVNNGVSRARARIVAVGVLFAGFTKGCRVPMNAEN